MFHIAQATVLLLAASFIGYLIRCLKGLLVFFMPEFSGTIITLSRAVSDQVF